MLTDYLKPRLNFRLDTPTNILIVINISIWLLTLISKLFLFHPYFLEVPSDLSLFLRTPWSLLTYCFLHTRFLHLLFNMLALYWFGHIAEDHFSPRQIVSIYLLGGIAGGLLFLLCFNTLPYFTAQFHQTYLLGASASVIAITTAAATAEPSRRINIFPIGSISLKWLAILLVFVSFLGVTGSNAGGDIAHLGGALLGVIYALLEKPIAKLFSRQFSRRNIFTSHSTTSHSTTSHSTTSHSSHSNSHYHYHFQRGTRSTDGACSVSPHDPTSRTDGARSVSPHDPTSRTDGACSVSPQEPDTCTDGARSVSPHDSDTCTDGARSVSPNSDIDAILSKIKTHGYSSLSPDEKQRLFKR